MEELQNFLKSNRIYNIGEFQEVMKQVRPYFRFASFKRGKSRYFNVPCAFDIETTSFSKRLENGKVIIETGADLVKYGRFDKPVNREKIAIMYVWTFNIYGLTIAGRTWDEFVELLHLLSAELKLSKSKRLLIYVHNLGFDFSFFRKWFSWLKVFSVKARTPVYALCDLGIEFRCSYILSGYKLETVGEHLAERGIDIQKMVGDLDYTLLRNSLTPLTEKEWAYCSNDVKVIVAYIGSLIDEEKDIDKIPLTKTGYVRRYCRNQCFYENGISCKDSLKRQAYRRLISSLRVTPEEYYQMKRAFQGGFTHANPWYVRKVVKDVTSFDFTSSYPSVMISEKFPMGPGEVVDVSNMRESEFLRNLRQYCCIFELELFDVMPKVYYDNYISESRCREVRNRQCNNGRIVRAEHLVITVTEIDYLLIQKFYTWSKKRIANFRRYYKSYLPKDFVLAILKLYGDKTQLKGVAGKEAEYNHAKEMLNSCYGMTVTDIVRDLIEYINNLWPGEGYRQDESPAPIDVQKEISKYNNNAGRFLFYGWGVYVTAYARRNLFTGIMEFGSDYIYSDTDSIKVINAEKHLDYIKEYNARMKLKLCRAMAFHGLSMDLIEPRTVKGTVKPLGAWDFDGHYSRFKTLGAKRYMVEYSQDERNAPKIRGKISITVSGLNKVVTLPYIQMQRESPFDFFRDTMYIPTGQTGKQTHTYIDEVKEGELTDYLGNTAHYKELSGVHLEPCDYTLSLSQEFVSFLLQSTSE